MKTIIRIDRSSIKNNPNAGNEISYVEGPKEVTGIINGDIPEVYKDRLIIISSEHVLDAPVKHKFIATGDVSDIIEALASDKRIAELTITSHQQEFCHLPEPDYFYEYENTPVRCQQCRIIVPVEAIIKDDEDYTIDICPHCDGRNTFEYEYEKIGDVIKPGT